MSRKLSPMLSKIFTKNAQHNKNNTYNAMGRFSRLQTDGILLTLPRKQDLIFHANCLQWRHFA